MKKVLVPIVTAGVCVGVLLTAGTPPAIGTTGPTITPVTGGMNSPRGIAFDARGSMYVSESGAAGAGEAGLTQTGKVSKFAWGSPTPAWTRTFTSFYATQPGASSADVLGPEGISALGNGCLKRDSEHGRWRHRRHGNDCQVTMIMSESTPGHPQGVQRSAHRPPGRSTVPPRQGDGCHPHDRRRRLPDV